MTSRPERDVEETDSTSEFVAKLRRMADPQETGGKFEVQIASERIYVSVHATHNIEHERGECQKGIEFQIKWTH